MKKSRTYISGAIANDPDYMAHFESAEKFLKDEIATLAKSFTGDEARLYAARLVINPAKENEHLLGSVPPLAWADFMAEDIKLLCDCDEIYMLRGWENSKGACVEKYIAEVLGLTVRYEKNAVQKRLYNEV